VSPSGSHWEMPIDRSSIGIAFHWTLCLIAVDRSLEFVRAWQRSMALALGTRQRVRHCNAYVSPAHSGIRTHYDARDVVVVQCSGVKRWLVAERAIDFPVRQNRSASAARQRSDFELLQRRRRSTAPGGHRIVNLVPGEVLFVPCGVWHATIALQPSVSLTFGFGD
jgi:ribosomal protein L16 Arg81 hydroxylase